MRRTNYGSLVDYDEPDENEKAIEYIVECAKQVGMEVIPGETALTIDFIAEVMKRMRGEANDKRHH